MKLMKMNLRKMRERRGITQTELAEMLGVRPNAVTQWENGYRYPRIPMLQRIAEALDCTVDALLEEESASEIE